VQAGGVHIVLISESHGKDNDAARTQIEPANLLDGEHALAYYKKLFYLFSNNIENNIL